jgi:non-heme chloroperoxidase
MFLPLRFRFIALVLTAMLACAQAPGVWRDVWRDKSPHRVRFVTVEDGVRLEVLDWGGSGRPVVLLAGYLTAHVYDDFAVNLSASCHVYGITRRGLGASSHPESGYSAQRSAEDVLKVLGALRLKGAVLAGHSFGGQDLTILGARNSRRIAGLVYLNSAEDATLVMADYGVAPADDERLPAAMRYPAAPTGLSFEAYRGWQARNHGIAFPEAELRQDFAANADGSVGRYQVPLTVRDAMFHGIQKAKFARIDVPVLAFFAFPASLEDQIQQYKPKDAEERTAMEQKYALDTAIQKRHLRDLQSGVPAARVIEMPGANYYIFLSNEAEVLRELGTFVAGLH